MEIGNGEALYFGKGNSFNEFIWITSLLFLGLFGFARSSWAGDYYVSTVTRGLGNCSF